MYDEKTGIVIQILVKGIDVKKAYSFRLSDEAMLAIRIYQKGHQLKSEGAAVEEMVTNFGVAERKDVQELAPVDKAQRIAPTQQVSSPARAASLDIKVEERPVTKEERKAKALAALAGAMKPKKDWETMDLERVEIEDTPLSDVPHAPFDLNIEGEPHRVAMMGRGGLWLIYLAGDGHRPLRKLSDGEMIQLWEKRI